MSGGQKLEKLFPVSRWLEDGLARPFRNEGRNLHFGRPVFENVKCIDATLCLHIRNRIKDLPSSVQQIIADGFEILVNKEGGLARNLIWTS
jgi:hypothetical protein